MSLIKKWTPETVIELGCYYTNMPNSVYHAHEDSVSKSTLDRFSESPYKYFNGKKKPQTKNMVIGSAMHSAILEVDIYNQLFVVEPNFDDCLSSDAAIKSHLTKMGQVGLSKYKQESLWEFARVVDPTIKIKQMEVIKWHESLGIKDFIDPLDDEAVFGVKSAIRGDGEKVFILTEDMQEKIDGMKKAILANDKAASFINADGYFELSGFSTNQQTGINTRHRFDKLAKIDGEWWGVDLKKTQSIDDYELSRTINKYRYHVQDTFYSDQFQQITGKELAGFVFIFVEEEYPHVVAVKQLCDISREIGKGLYQDDLNRFKEYKVGNLVAHNNAELEYISLPEYVMASFEQEIF